MKPTASILAVAAAIALASTSHHVAAHGGLTNPESRGIRTMKLDLYGTFGFPIEMRGDYTKGKGGDCLGFTPDKNLQSVSTGKSKIKMMAYDGANHIGPCTVHLVDPQDKSKRLQVGSMKDCMRSLHPGPGNKGDKPILAEMEINVPTSGLPCHDGHCVLMWSLEAQHLKPYEHYNNCADVKIAGAGGSAPAPAPAAAPAATPKPTSKPSSTPTTKPTVKPTSKPSSTPDQPGTVAPPSGAGLKWCGKTADLTTWCGWNCPLGFCPPDYCRAC